MERRFRVFLILVMALAVLALAGAAVLTYARLHDSAARLEREDRAAYAALMERLAVPEGIGGVQIQVRSTMGDYDRYGGFDKSLLAGLTFAHHEYLWGGSGSASEDVSITITLPVHTANPVLAFLDDTFGTDFLTRTEKVVLYRDGDVYRTTYREASFVMECPAMTAWMEEMRGK